MWKLEMVTIKTNENSELSIKDAIAQYQQDFIQTRMHAVDQNLLQFSHNTDDVEEYIDQICDSGNADSKFKTKSELVNELRLDLSSEPQIVPRVRFKAIQNIYPIPQLLHKRSHLSPSPIKRIEAASNNVPNELNVNQNDTNSCEDGGRERVKKLIKLINNIQFMDVNMQESENINSVNTTTNFKV
eukprot:251545_1